MVCLFQERGDFTVHFKSVEQLLEFPFRSKKGGVNGTGKRVLSFAEMYDPCGNPTVEVGLCIGRALFPCRCADRCLH